MNADETIKTGTLEEHSPNKRLSKNKYEEYLRRYLSHVVLPISFNDLQRAIPYEKCLQFDDYQLYQAFYAYIMNQEVDYILRLFQFPLTCEVILKHVTPQQWEDLRNLYRKTYVIWTIGIHTQSQYYYNHLFEEVKPTIRETYQRLHGRVYLSYVDGREFKYDIAELPEMFDQIYRGVCVLRTWKDMHTPVRSAYRLRNNRVSDTRLNITRASAVIASVHERLIDESKDLCEGYNRYGVPLEISEFTKKLSLACLNEQDNPGDDFWKDTYDNINYAEHWYPSEVHPVLDVLTNSYGSKSYFHPRHSENPEDHYRFVYSTIKNDKKTIRKLQELFDRISEKKILTQEYYDKRELFEEVHRELLLSPNLAEWYENDYTRTKEHFCTQVQTLTHSSTD